MEKRMKEEKWENSGRDRISLQELVELYQDGYEFVVHNGHITSVITNLGGLAA